MHLIRGLLASCALLLIFAPAFAQDKAADLIIGRWEAKEKFGEKEIAFVLEFTKDKVKMSWEGGNVEGTYKLNGEKEIEITATYMGETRTEKSAITVDKDSLSIKAPKGKEAKYKRMK